MTSQRLIDGIVAERVERPTTADDIPDLLRGAVESAEWVLPIGGGTAMTGANPVDTVPVALDMTGIDGIAEYEPTDLTISVRAGTRWGILQAALGAEGQTLPIDVPFPEQATVGGVVATGYAGPRCLRDGSLKDLLLGASFVRGDGLLAKAGGMVVKNVSGFEIPRLLHGSWGSLAVITSVNLKVIPIHESDLTMESDALGALDAAERVLALTGARSAVAAAVVDGTLEQAAVAVRLTGRDGPTRDLSREIRDEASLPWRATTDDSRESARWWQRREDRLATEEPGRVSIEVGCQASGMHDVLRALQRGVSNPGEVSMQASPGVGSILLGFDAAAVSLDAWMRIWAEHGLDKDARFVVASAPREWRSVRDVWSIPPGPRAIMQSLKSTFDSDDVLSRGRLWTSSERARA